MPVGDAVRIHRFCRGEWASTWCLIFLAMRPMDAPDSAGRDDGQATTAHYKLQRWKEYEQANPRWRYERARLWELSEAAGERYGNTLGASVARHCHTEGTVRVCYEGNLAIDILDMERQAAWDTLIAHGQPAYEYQRQHCGTGEEQQP